jgi:UDP-N-acetylmuramoyl-L-alanyl-D-glutamate--2,6-diaminopimelate ligase
MNLLSDLLYKAGIEEVSGDTSISIEKVCFDSRKVEADTLFIAIRGTVVDGHHFIAEVIAKGATAVVCEEMPAERFQSVTYIQVKDSSLALAIIAANFYDHPSDKLKLIGVTGTNGKTTVVTLLHALFRQLGYKVGLLSTVVNRINDLEIPSTHTTPDPLPIECTFSQDGRFGMYTLLYGSEFTCRSTASHQWIAI